MKKNLLWVCVATTLLFSFAGAASYASPKAIPGGTEVQQQRTVTGVVKDSKGVAIVGANVMEKGALNGAITDDNGYFSLTVPSNATLVISFIGFTTQEIAVGDQDNFTITLLEDSQYLKEVVFVGYGTQKKVNLTGAVDVVTSEVLDNRPLSNLTQGLQGAVPNLQITFLMVSQPVVPTTRSVVPDQSAKVALPSFSSMVSKATRPCSTLVMWPVSLS